MNLSQMVSVYLICCDPQAENHNLCSVFINWENLKLTLL